MSNNLVCIKNDKGVEDAFTDSKIIANGTGNEHRAVRQLINNYEVELNEFGMVTFEMLPLPSGQKEKVYYLNEMQATFLITLTNNNEKVVKFKMMLVKEFFTMRQSILEHRSHEWKQTRLNGKLVRRGETDAIRDLLIPLTISQGSNNYNMLYTTYSKLVNSCIGIPPNSRERATWRILHAIVALETLIEKTIKQEYDKGKYYKDIYQVCKEKCKMFVELSCLPDVKLLN